MSEVEIEGSELRDNMEVLLERVAAGESITITVAGRAVARLDPIGGRPRFIDRDRFAREVLAHRADPGLLEPTSDRWRRTRRTIFPPGDDGLDRFRGHPPPG